ncbi:MAG: hypothetical protein IJ910_04270 [Bacteroidaceae bacterium]|nr:hypothetical protein [Bacteroidaceae bacterium]
MTAAAKLQQFFELEPQNSQEKEKHPPKKYQNTTITSYSETGKPPEEASFKHKEFLHTSNPSGLNSTTTIQVAFFSPLPSSPKGEESNHPDGILTKILSIL